MNPEETSTERTQAPEPVKNTFTVPEKIDIIKDFQDQAVPESVESSAEAASGEAPLTLVIQVGREFVV